MDLRLVTVAEQPHLAHASWAQVNQHGFAEFMYHDPVADEHFGALYDRFAPFQFCLLDDDDVIQGDRQRSSQPMGSPTSSRRSAPMPSIATP